MTSITFSTCWYNFKAKFDNSTYLHWIDNMLSNVNNYNLVIYSDESSSQCLKKYLHNPRIKLIIKPHELFYNYRYKDKWIENHANNVLLNNRIDWTVNMLWSEKIHFVHETMCEKYFDTDFYGWCDIGYFRNRPNDMSIEQLSAWPNKSIIENLKKNEIYYACVNNDNNYIRKLLELINNKNANGLPNIPIPQNQMSIAGGFFVCHKEKIDWWRDTYDTKLKLYFDNGYLVKDDQIIIVDCIFSNLSEFCLCKEQNHYDNWFLFQRYLLV
jgi:hypothetical protein